jgi:hypothetical protein
MAKKRLFISSLVLVVGLLGFNWFIGRTARTWPRIVLREVADARGIGTLVLGNSLLASGFHEASYRAASLAPNDPAPIVNAACGATLPAEHLQFYQLAKKGSPRIPLIIYGYLLDQLTAPTDASWRDLSGNRAMFYYADIELGLSLYHPKNALEAFLFRATRYFPAIYERLNIWRRVEILRRQFDRWGLPDEATTRFGRAADFAGNAFQPMRNAAFSDTWRKAVASQVSLSVPVKSIISQARATGSKVIVIEMPMPLAQRRYFGSDGAWKPYRDYVRKLIEREGGTYLDALDWYSDDARYFADDLHLNPLGAVGFSKRLASFVTRGLRTDPIPPSGSVNRAASPSETPAASDIPRDHSRNGQGASFPDRHPARPS